ncbi:phasin family protein [Xenophilus arseniciresistens]|uniref:Phasin family protein n=1 Tax=Xenophilus arseniciresistens TaxID=1283306 RepID=A0AAE3NA55_9BURK|nr:phasin family protein [Xenophilus arseniciresistens]MDA7418905.1 phasin family protein [Xenophilus arseniciresistens]
MVTRSSDDKPARRKAPAAPRAAAGKAAAAPAPERPRSSTGTARQRAAAADACPPVADPAAGSGSFWRAGLRALDSVRHDVQRRQATVIETLLGIPAAAGTQAQRGLAGLPGLDAFGLRKFEDVFDQRVAAALERLGMPTREELEALHHKLDQVLARLEQMDVVPEPAAAPAASPARKPRKPRARPAKG